MHGTMSIGNDLDRAGKRVLKGLTSFISAPLANKMVYHTPDGAQISGTYVWSTNIWCLCINILEQLEGRALLQGWHYFCTDTPSKENFQFLENGTFYCRNTKV